MLRDNQLYTVILLVVLGFLIYNLANCDSTEGFAETETKPEMETPKMLTATTLLPETKNESRPRPETKPVTVENEQVSLFDFQGNDDAQTGASLEDAFERPIPQDTRTDTVDVQKNNVKKYDAKDFLPKEINSEWFDTDFSQAKTNIKDEKLINTEKYVIGINTVGQSLKNASYDIRGTVANPKFSVSPWNNSTFEPDFNLKSLC